MGAQSSPAIDYNPSNAIQQSLVHDPFNATMNIDEEYIDAPLLMPPIPSSTSETPPKRRKKDSGKAMASAKQVIIKTSH